MIPTFTELRSAGAAPLLADVEVGEFTAVVVVPEP